MRILTAITTLFCVSSIIYSAIAADTTADDEEADRLIVAMAEKSETVRKGIQSINDSYNVVFIPGILGSVLKIGNKTYGDDKLAADWLAYDPDSPKKASCETLNQFKVRIGRGAKIWTTDIYGDALNTLKDAIGSQNLWEFCYDWRADIDKSAKELDNYLKSNLKNKKFTIVAHSMGGLVAWQWKNKYYKDWKDRDRLVTLVAVGSPLEGSCEAIKTIIDGYGAFFERIAFSGTEAAILTFPSVYQLLPKYDENTPCMKIRRQGVPVGWNHHDPEKWFGRTGGDYELRKEYADQVKLDFETYKTRVKKAILDGQNFRKDFNNNPKPDDHIYLVYADTKTVESEYLVVPHGKSWLSATASKHIEGDGRVSVKSATNSNKCGTGAVFGPLDNQHSELFIDPRFVKFALKNLIAPIKQAINFETRGYASSDPNLVAEFRQQGLVWNDVAIPTGLPSNPELLAAKKVLESYNVDHNVNMVLTDPRFAGARLDGGDQIGQILKAAEIAENSKDADIKTADALFGTAIALDVQRDRVPTSVYVKLGNWRLTESTAARESGKDVEASRKAAEASRYFVYALDLGDKDKIYFTGYLFNMLGQSYELTGSRILALEAYEGGAKFGNFHAKERLEILRGLSPGDGRFKAGS